MKPSEPLLAREMMFGIEEEFEYDRCPDCNSLQLRDVPIDLSKYYQVGYYSRMDVPDVEDEGTIFGLLKLRMRRWRALHATGKGHALGALVNRRWPDPGLTQLTGTRIDFDASVLDVGCGAAPWLLNQMAKLGFKNLLGIDPFIETDIVTSAGASVLKREIAWAEGKFDLIMFHHSFEHVVDPLATLRAAREHLREERRFLIRVPTPSSEAFDRYGAAWYQLDAPRHLTLVSREGMNILADKAGFWVERRSGRFRLEAIRLQRAVQKRHPARETGNPGILFGGTISGIRFDGPRAERSSSRGPGGLHPPAPTELVDVHVANDDALRGISRARRSGASSRRAPPANPTCFAHCRDGYKH